MSDLKMNTAGATRRRFLKYLGASSLLPWMAGSVAAAEPSRDEAVHRVLSCNIRVALPDDEAKGVGWPQRKAICIGIIRKHAPDIICLQEVIKVQAEDFRKAFPEFLLFGFDGPYMDAHPVGYHWVAKNPILFDTRRYELTGGGTYWLSETPLIAATKSWGTARARNANWVRLREKRTGKEFRVVNLHLDHVADEAKVKQAALVVQESSQYLPDFPQLLAGDFNARHNSPVFHSVREGGWKDTYEAVHGKGEAGFTGHRFQGVDYERGHLGGRIDFIWHKGSVAAADAAIIRDSVDGVYPSDHFFLSADVKIK